VLTPKPSPDCESPRSPPQSNQFPNPSESEFVGTLLLEIVDSEDANPYSPTQRSLIAQFSSSFLEYIGFRSKDLMPPEAQSLLEPGESTSNSNNPYESNLITPSVPRTAKSAGTDERAKRMDVERASLLKSVKRKIEFRGRPEDHGENDEEDDEEVAASSDSGGPLRKRKISEMMDLDSFRPLTAVTETVKNQIEQLRQQCANEFGHHSTRLDVMGDSQSAKLTMFEEKLNKVVADCKTYFEEAVQTNIDDVHVLGEGLKLTREELGETCDTLSTLEAKVEELPRRRTFDDLVTTVKDMTNQLQHLTRASNISNENFSMHLKGIESLADRCNNLENGMAELTEALGLLNRKLFDSDGSVSKLLAMFILTTFDEDLIRGYENHKRPRLD
jgi:hypothetical protein